MIKRKPIVLSAFSLLALFFLVLCWPMTSNATQGTGGHTGSIVAAGLQRTYRAHVPLSHNKTKPVPLVIALHGGGGTGEKMVKLTVGRFNKLSYKEGFIVVYPDGIGKHWNDGRSKGETKYRAHKENIDDTGFTSALIDYFIKEYNISPKCVYVTGISNGAIMSYRLACELSDKITAIAPVDGNMSQKFFPMCSPSKPISVLAINNTKDPLMPWNGGDITGPLGVKKLGKVLSVAQTIEFWVKHNECSSSPTITEEPDKDPKDDTRVRREEYGGGKEGTEVVLYAIEGGGHTWPGGHQYLPASIVGKISKDIDANEVIWNFFKKDSRK
jgi:polyhydroxybutyrate depolymerase